MKETIIGILLILMVANVVMACLNLKMRNPTGVVFAILLIILCGSVIMFADLNLK